MCIAGEAKHMVYGSGISAAGATGAGIGAATVTGTSMLGYLIIGAVVAISTVVLTFRIYAHTHG